MAIANEVAVILGATDREPILATQWTELPIHSKKELAVTGRDLMQAGVQPGPQLGADLQTLEQQVVRGELPNDAPKLIAAIQ